MLRIALVTASLWLLMSIPPGLAQQPDIPDWSPPSAQMPAMPTVDDLRGDWRAALADWFGGVDRVAGISTGNLQAEGEGAGMGGEYEFVRFSSGHLPVMAWSDRSGNGRADLVEIFRNGRVVIQVIDAGYDGRADTVRYYDAGGELIDERRP